VRRSLLAAVALVLTFAVLGTASLAVGGQVTPDDPLDADEFTLIQPMAPVAAVRPAPSVANGGPPPEIGDFRAAERSFAARPQPEYDVGPRVVVKQPLQLAASRTGHRASGVASWYCLAGVSPCHNAYAGGLYAAAGPALRVGDWRGRVVRVCEGGGCVNVTLIDWCACPDGRVIDLYSDAFRRLTPLSAGTMTVSVSW